MTSDNFKTTSGVSPNFRIQSDMKIWYIEKNRNNQRCLLVWVKSEKRIGPIGPRVVEQKPILLTGKLRYL